MKDLKDPYTLSLLAQDLSALAARLKPEDAAAATSQAVTILFQSPIDTPSEPPHRRYCCPAASHGKGRSLGNRRRRSCIPGRPRSYVAALCAIHTAEPPSCRLPTQQLVELLKMPPSSPGPPRRPRPARRVTTAPSATYGSSCRSQRISAWTSTSRCRPYRPGRGRDAETVRRPLRRRIKSDRVKSLSRKPLNRQRHRRQG